MSVGDVALLHAQTAQKGNLTILQHLTLKVTFPRKGKEPAKVPYGKIKNPPPGPVERDDVRTIGSPHTSPSRKENVKRIRVDVAHPMTRDYSSSWPWGDDLQHAFIVG